MVDALATLLSIHPLKALSPLEGGPQGGEYYKYSDNSLNDVIRVQSASGNIPRGS